MVKLLIEMGKGNNIASLISGLEEPAESVELRFHVGDVPDLQANGDRILKALEDAASSVEGWSLEKENYEGVRVNCDASHGNGWLLLRKSLHEPIMPLNIESDTKGGALIIANALYDIIADEKTLDLTPIKEFCNR